MEHRRYHKERTQYRKEYTQYHTEHTQYHEEHIQEFITLQELEEKYIKQVLRATSNNKSRAAKILGIHPTSLFRKLKSIKKKKPS